MKEKGQNKDKENKKIQIEKPQEQIGRMLKKKKKEEKSTICSPKSC